MRCEIDGDNIIIYADDDQESLRLKEFFKENEKKSWCSTFEVSRTGVGGGMSHELTAIVSENRRGKEDDKLFSCKINLRRH